MNSRYPQAALLAVLLVLAAGLIQATVLVGRQDADREPQAASFTLPNSAQAYEQQRKTLVAADDGVRFDAGLKLNAQEQLLNEHLIALREALRKEYIAAKRFPPAEPFHGVRDEIRQTALYALLHEMPKGGVLHLHTSSTAPAEWIVTTGIKEENCCVCWPNDNGDSIRGELGFFLPDKIPAGYQSVQAVMAKEPDFSDKLLELITISSADRTLKRSEIWGKFNQIFKRVDDLLSYQPVFVKYYLAAFQTLLDDHVTYVELRAGFNSLHDLNGKTWDHRQRAALMWDLRNQVRQTNPQFDVKLIYSGYRALTVEAVWEEIEQAVELRKIWAGQNFMLGFDLVGEEDAGHTTVFFLPDWVRLKTYLAQQKTTLPFYFHDGESDWPSDENLYDAMLLGTRRIGHGFNLFHFPALEASLKRHGVAVEVCPISNQQLRYVDDLRVHPAAGYLNRGVPCVLGNDDPGIFGNDGLSYDFWEAIMAWDLDLQSVKQLAINSLVYSGMTDAEKSVALAEWHKAWDGWVDQSVATLRQAPPPR
ncbi:MAG: hypothetical protein K8T25_01490 [Planctomycetia bacterium]|nr:hypothetical protein [Planctomycetia bacterium]